MRSVLLAICGTMIGAGAASGCQCANPGGLQGEALEAWQIERATNVVRGRIVKFSAGKDVLFFDERVVKATMRIERVIKGSLAAGDVTLITSFDGGSCGIPGSLLHAAARDVEVTMSLHDQRDEKNEFVVGMCGYFKTTDESGDTEPADRNTDRN